MGKELKEKVELRKSAHGKRAQGKSAHALTPRARPHTSVPPTIDASCAENSEDSTPFCEKEHTGGRVSNGKSRGGARGHTFESSTARKSARERRATGVDEPRACAQ